MGMSAGDRTAATPPGVIVVEIFLYLGAVFELLAGVVILVTGAVSDRATDLETFELMLAGFLIVAGLINAILARAIGLGREWARVVYVALQLLAVLGGVVSVVDGQPRGLLFFFVPLVLIFLLYIPSSHQYFERAR
ncbi:MAG: hypothetical protein M3179_12655 [Actinomycetota bacterium]|nr:hypothetical protein [Actinomycetota bacterium]